MPSLRGAPGRKASASRGSPPVTAPRAATTDRGSTLGQKRWTTHPAPERCLRHKPYVPPQHDDSRQGVVLHAALGSREGTDAGEHRPGPCGCPRLPVHLGRSGASLPDEWHHLASNIAAGVTGGALIEIDVDVRKVPTARLECDPELRAAIRIAGGDEARWHQPEVGGMSRPFGEGDRPAPTEVTPGLQAGIVRH